MTNKERTWEITDLDGSNHRTVTLAQYRAEIDAAKIKALAQDEKYIVRIHLQGGLVQNVEKPDGIRVEVLDFDVEGNQEDKIEKVDGLEPHILSIWE